MLLKEAQSSLVASLILLANFFVLEVRPSRHPAVDLGREGLHIMVNPKVGTESLDVLGILVLGSQHGHGDSDILSIIGINHGGMALHRGLELGVLGRGQACDLSTPAVSEDRPALEALAVGSELVGFVDERWNLGQVCWRSGLGLEEIPQLLLLFVGLRREPGDVRRLALKEIWHEDTVFLLARGSEDIGTLNCLSGEAEDVYFFSKSS